MSDSVFINSKRKLEFNNGSNEKLTIKRGYIGSVPAWVTETWLFKAACKDSSITFVGQSKNQSSSNESDNAELLALRERAKELCIKNAQTMRAETLKKKIEEAEKALNSGIGSENDDKKNDDPPGDA